MILNAGKCQGYNFYGFWVIKGKPTEGVKLPSPSRLGLKRISDKCCAVSFEK